MEEKKSKRPRIGSGLAASADSDQDTRYEKVNYPNDGSAKRYDNASQAGNHNYSRPYQSYQRPNNAYGNNRYQNNYNAGYSPAASNSAPQGDAASTGDASEKTFDQPAYQPRQNNGYQPRQNNGYQPRQNNGYQPRQNNGYQPRQQQGGYQQRPNNGYQPRQQQGGYQQRPNNGYQPRQQQGGYQQRPNNGYQPRQQQGGYQQRPNNGYQPRQQQGGYQQRPNNGYQQQGGYQQRPNNGYQPRQQHGGYNNNGRPQHGGYNNGRPQQQRNPKFTPRPRQIDYVLEDIDPNSEIRLNKYMANAGVCSRREADEFILAGKVKVNGNVVTELGTKITRNDVVEYDEKVVTPERKCYVLLNKPKDCVTTNDDPNGRLTVLDIVRNACEERIYPVGRLDRNTTGVLLLTNDGDLASKLTHPKFVKKKIYHVWTDKEISEEDMQRIADGIELEDGEIHADAISYVSETARNQAGIEIHSGRNRIVRRIFEHLGYRVTKLDRVYFAGLTKKNLPRGRWRYLTQEEVNFLRMGSFE